MTTAPLSSEPLAEEFFTWISGELLRHISFKLDPILTLAVAHLRAIGHPSLLKPPYSQALQVIQKNIETAWLD